MGPHVNAILLSVTSSSSSSQVVSMSFKSRLMMSIQFFLGRPGVFLSSHCIALRAWRANELNLTKLTLYTSRNELKWNELKWTELNWNELNWNELKWNELKWTELNWNELKWNELHCQLVRFVQSVQCNWTGILVQFSSVALYTL